MLDYLGEYISYVNINQFSKADKYATMLRKKMIELNKFEVFQLIDKKHHLTADVAMFTAKLYPSRPRRKHSGANLSRKKVFYESRRIEELLQLRHRIIKKIGRMTDDIIAYLYETNPDDILPKFKLHW